jgi:hypothetical protein
LHADRRDTRCEVAKGRRAKSVPSFNILYKTLEDDDGWERGLVPFLPDRDEALDFFNKTMAKDEELGQFTFHDSDLPSDYNLVEVIQFHIREEKQLHPLYKKLTP